MTSYMCLLKSQQTIGPPEKPGLLNPSIYRTTALGSVESIPDIVPRLMNANLPPYQRVPRPPNGNPRNQTGCPRVKLPVAATVYGVGIVSSVSKIAMSTSGEDG